MATFTHPRLPVRTDRALRAPRADRRSATSRAASGDDATHDPGEPRRAASVLPVLLAFGALVALSVAAAYFGREALSLVGSFLQTS